jgi:predicted Rossmann fold nucleotide-binding protein DprA/Smf involved in DNA uptake
MNAHDYLNDDGQALLALCSNLALRDDGAAGGLEPFKLSAWNQLARQIQASPLKRPTALRGRTVDELVRELGISTEDAGRIVRLLDRSGSLALELEGLFNRGIWAVTRVDELYPARLRDALKHQAPTVLFGAGDVRLLGNAGVAIIGSRNIDEGGAAFARELGRKAVAAGLAVVSGGARGTDRLAMEGALESGGRAFGVLADSLERVIRQLDLRQLLLDGCLVLVTPYAPTAGFSVGAAMGRNKVIYGLAEFGVVASSDFQTGGTWAGAVEALKAEWCPVFVRESAGAPKGNAALIKAGAVPLPESELGAISDLAAWLREHGKVRVAETDLFGMALREGREDPR